MAFDSFEELTRRQNAWSRAYKNVAGRAKSAPAAGPSPDSGMVSGGATQVASPAVAAPSLEETVRSRTGIDLSFLPAAANEPSAAGFDAAVKAREASALQAARQRSAARQLGGTSIDQARSVFQGRQDARDILARAAQPKSPAETMAVGGSSPLRGEARNFAALAGAEQAKREAAGAKYDQRFADWKANRGEQQGESMGKSPHYDAVTWGLYNRLGRTPTPEEMAAGMDEFNTKYNVYSRGIRGQVSKLRPEEFAARYFESSRDPEINASMQVAMDAATAAREARAQNQQQSIATNLFQSRGILPQDPVLAKSLMEGAMSNAALQGNPFAAQMQIEGSKAQAARDIAQGQADAQRFAAKMGLRGQKQDTNARVAEADAARAESRSRFDAQLAQLEQQRQLDSQRLQQSGDQFDKKLQWEQDQFAQTPKPGELTAPQDVLGFMAQANEMSPQMAGERAAAEAGALVANAQDMTTQEKRQFVEKARAKAFSEHTAMYDQMRQHPVLAPYFQQVDAGGGAGTQVANPMPEEPVTTDPNYVPRPVATENLIRDYIYRHQADQGRMPTVEEVKMAMAQQGYQLPDNLGYVPDNIFQSQDTTDAYNQWLNQNHSAFQADTLPQQRRADAGRVFGRGFRFMP